MSQGVAVFLGPSKKYVGVEFSVEDSTVSVKQRSNGQVIETFDIVEPVCTMNKRVQAWDVQSGDTVKRLAVVAGCGCGGLPPYQPDPGYSGRLRAG